MPLNENATNEILPFAFEGVESSSDHGDLLTLASYKTRVERRRGHQIGIAKRAVANRQMRQSAHMAAGIAQFIANRYLPGVVDDADLDKVEEGMKQAMINLIEEYINNAEDNDTLGIPMWSREDCYDPLPHIVWGGDLMLYIAEKPSGPCVSGVGAKDPTTTTGYWISLPDWVKKYISFSDGLPRPYGDTGTVLTVIGNNTLGWKSVSSSGGESGIKSNRRFSQTSGVFIVPAGVKELKITLTAGGGSGARVPADSILEASGGAAGGTVIGYMAVSGGQSISYIIGAGGATVSAGNNGNDGGNSSCASLIAYGGKGGRIGNLFGSPWIPGGTASGGLINLRGGFGFFGMHGGGTADGSLIISGSGGASYWGSGGVGATSTLSNIATTSQMDATNPGSGGGGSGHSKANEWIVSPIYSGKGANGCILFEWFEVQ